MSFQALNQLIFRYKTSGNHPAVLSTWQQLFNKFANSTPNKSTCVNVLYSCNQLRSALAASVCEEIYTTTRHTSIQQDVIFSTSIIKTLQQCNRSSKALEVWGQLGSLLKWDRVTFICVLGACADVGRSALTTGESIRSRFTLAELKHDTRLLSSVFNMYVKCGQPQSAVELAVTLWDQYGMFGDKIIFTCILNACMMVGAPSLDLVSNIHQFISSPSSSVEFDTKLLGILVTVYQRNRKYNEILELWWSGNGSTLADEDTCSQVLLACAHVASNAAIKVCESIRYRVKSSHLQVQLVSSLHKCNRPDLMVSVWKEMIQTNTSVGGDVKLLILSACATLATSDAMEIAQKLYFEHGGDKGQFHEAMLKVFIHCKQSHLAVNFWQDEILHVPSPSKRVVMLVLQACGNSLNLEATTSLQSFISSSAELQQETEVFTSLVHAYTQCKQPARALSVWNANKTSVKWNEVGLTCALQACAQLGGIPKVMEAVEELVEQSQLVEQDQHLLTTIVNVYIKCGIPERALQYFFRAINEDSSQLNTVTATAALMACAGMGKEAFSSGESICIMMEKREIERDVMFNNARMTFYTRCGHPDIALQLWNIIKKQDTPTSVSYVCAIAACAASGSPALKMGQQIHSTLPRQMQRDHVIISALITMYLRCGQPLEALKMWGELLRNRVAHNEVTYISVLRACAAIGTPASIAVGEALHSLISSETLLRNEILQNALLTMYTTCGEPQKAITLWEGLTNGGTTISANEFIRTSIFTATFRMAIVPTSVKKLLVLTQADIYNGVINNEALENSMLNVYAKCGDINGAKELFSNILTRRGTPYIGSWNTMINAYAKHRDGAGACSQFEQLQSLLTPDSVTFVALLNACAHSGLIDECKRYYSLMQSYYSIFKTDLLLLSYSLKIKDLTPTIEHQCCVIDAIARHGDPLHAEEFILENIPSHNQNIVLWMTLLGSCRSQVITANNKIELVALAERAFQNIDRFDPLNAGAHVTLGNIYESAGLFEKTEAIRRNMEVRSIKKIPGKSWLLDNDGKYHEFFANDQGHPQIKEIHTKWDELAQIINYRPDLKWALQNENIEQKTTRLCRHSEKLAVCFALLVIPPPQTIQIIKNLRMCGDCHAATAIISQVVNRRIVVRDSKTFHHFEHGVCSCNGKY